MRKAEEHPEGGRAREGKSEKERQREAMRGRRVKERQRGAKRDKVRQREAKREGNLNMKCELKRHNDSSQRLNVIIM